MTLLITKYALTALIIVIVSEVAKRADRWGALIASLPLVTIMVMLWLYVETKDTTKIANHAYYTFWFVLPTLPMFLLMPWMLQRGVPFWLTMLSGALLTFGCFYLTHLVAKHFDIHLLP